MRTTTTFKVTGLRELLRVVDQLPKDIKRDVRTQLRNTAIPIRDEAQSLFLAQVSPDTKKTRFGISVRRVGTITVEQRVKGKSGRVSARRPKFTDLEWERSLSPAFENNKEGIMDDFNRVLDSLERRWAVGR